MLQGNLGSVFSCHVQSVTGTSIPRIRTTQTTSEVFIMCYKPRDGLKSWQATTFLVHLPDVTLALSIRKISNRFWVFILSSIPYYYQLQDMIHRKQVKSIVLVHRLQGSTLYISFCWSGWVDQVLTHQFMGANVICEIPLLDTSCLVAGYELALVWMDADIVY